MSDLSKRLMMHCGNDSCEPCVKCAQIMQEAADELDRLLAIEREYNICRDRVAEIAEIASRESEQHVEQRREIDRLQAIVERLPKTADGVPIAPGSTVWAWMGDDGLIETEIQRVGIGGWYAACYSTREAAEKARAT